MTEEPVAIDPDFEPVRVTESVIAAWRWDAWVQAAARIDRNARWLSVVLGIAVVAGALAVGYALLPGESWLSALMYGPVLGYLVYAWTPRSWLTTRPLKAVLNELRPEVAPKIVDELDDENLLRLLVDGGTLVTGLSTRIVAERRDAAVSLVAREYDLSKSRDWDAGSAGG